MRFETFMNYTHCEYAKQYRIILNSSILVPNACLLLYIFQGATTMLKIALHDALSPVAPKKTGWYVCMYYVWSLTAPI